MRAELSDVTDDGEKLKARRERLAMSLTDLAERAGIGTDTLSDMEKGKRQARANTYAKIVRALRDEERAQGIEEAVADPEAQRRPVIVRFPDPANEGEIVFEGDVDTEEKRLDFIQFIEMMMERRAGLRDQSD